MFYAIVGKNWHAGVVTRDAIVVQATENFQFACGAAIGDIIRWAASRGMVWSVSAVVPPGLALVDARPPHPPR